MSEFWIGFSDEICIIANKPYRELHRYHLNHLSEEDFPILDNSTVHLVGRWWNADNAVEVRYAALDFKNVTFVKHLAPLKACESFPSESQRWSFADAQRRAAYLSD